MRILVSAWPAVGHLFPMLPLVHAAKRAGHDVIVTSGADIVPQIEQRGFVAHPAGPTLEQAYAAAEKSVGTTVGSLPPQEEMAASATFLFGAAAVQRAHELTAFCRRWEPDLVIHDVLELGAPAAAESLGIRHATHSYGPIVPGTEVFAAVIGGVLSEAGLVDPIPAIIAGEYVDICPPGLQPAGIEPWRAAIPLRPVAGEVTRGESLPAGLDAGPHPGVVYVTLGTVTNRQPAVFSTVFEACSNLPITVVATTGPGLDPADLGALPPNVIVLPYVSQALLLPRCTAVMSHGGAGTMLGALCHGLPQVCLPQGTDQPYNAAALAGSGAGLVIDPDGLTADVVAGALERILAEPAFRAAAVALQAEIEAMPSADEVVGQLVGTSD